RWKQAWRDAVRLRLLLLNRGDRLRLEPLQLLFGKCWIEQDVAEQLERARELPGDGVEGDVGGVQRRAGADLGTELLRAGGDLQRITRFRPVADHREREIRSPRLRKTVRSVSR